jgi:hypothetical protein
VDVVSRFCDVYAIDVDRFLTHFSYAVIRTMGNVTRQGSMA